MDFGSYHKDKLAELPPELVEKCVKHLATIISIGDKKWLRQQIAEDPEGWWARNVWHFRGGMVVRNMLRSVVGDEQLPTNNWDDYYLCILEEAVKIEDNTTLEYDDWDQW